MAETVRHKDGRFAKGCGRVAGSGMKLGYKRESTIRAKEAIDSVFAGLGGADFLRKYAEEYPKDFIEKVWIKTLPILADVNVSSDFSAILEAARNRAPVPVEQTAIGGVPTVKSK